MNDNTGNVSYLPAAVASADPDEFLSSVLSGWKRQQLAKNFQPSTAKRRASVVMRMATFIGKHPWEWLPADCDDFFAHLRGVESCSHNTVRAYQSDVRTFLEYATSPAYDWNERCGQLFGTVFSPVVSEYNTATHKDETPDGKKRPFTTRELQEFFDLADLEPERILNSGRKGALAAWRDAVMMKTMYSWGLRFSEARHLIPADFSRNVRSPGFGEWGVLRVRHGKSKKGSPPKQRTVLTVFDWSVDMLDHWTRVGLPRYGGHRATPLFPTGAGKMLDNSALRRRLVALLDELGFPPGLDLHSLRRSYATHLQTELGFDAGFAQLQLGHDNASITGVYTIAAPDYRARELSRVLSDTLQRSGATLSSPDTKESR